MVMTYPALIAAKGSPGAVATFSNYTLLDTTTIVDEAQSLLWLYLRCREMRSEYRFYVPAGNSEVPLPTGFLDPIGRLYTPSLTSDVLRKEESFVRDRRIYNETPGVLGSNPFTTTSGSSLVSVSLTGHGFNQGSLFYIAGAAAVGGLTLNGSFPIVQITDANDFVIDTSILGQPATSSTTGGGSAATYLCDNLIQGTPQWWAIWDEAIKFDVAFSTPLTFSLLFFKQPPLLSNTNQTNFVTSRYAILFRKVLQASAADFMEDDAAYEKHIQALTPLLAQVSMMDDLQYRGMEHMTETPSGGGGWDM